MQAMVVNHWSEPGDLQLAEFPDPAPGPGQVTINVRAIGCNFFDILMIQGKYQIRPPFPFSPGSEVAGEVREVGPGVQAFSAGLCHRCRRTCRYGGQDAAQHEL